MSDLRFFGLDGSSKPAGPIPDYLSVLGNNLASQPRPPAPKREADGDHGAARGSVRGSGNGRSRLRHPDDLRCAKQRQCGSGSGG